MFLIFRDLQKVALIVILFLTCFHKAARSFPIDDNHALKPDIYGGSQVGTCSFPNVVMLELLTDQGVAGLCSGTLIHPSIVVYAAHCGSNIRYIYFGETIGTLKSPPYSKTASNLSFYAQGPARTVVPKQCKLYPGHDAYGGTDYAYCLLSDAINDVPIVPVLMGCEQNNLVANTNVTLVGFGYDKKQQMGIKQAVSLPLSAIVGRKAIVEPANASGNCQGDSGGPAFIEIPTTLDANNPSQSSWRVFGITSYGSESCGQLSVDGLMYLAVPWIEADSGIDVTTCTDAQGNWMPTSLCGRFPMSPEQPAASSSWLNGCATSDLSGFNNSCGKAYLPPLSLTFSGLVSDVTYLIGSSFQPQITIEKNNDNASITSVEATWDGRSLSASIDSTVPGGLTYLFDTQTILEGNHILTAQVKDALGNSMDRSWQVYMGALPSSQGCQSFAFSNPWFVVLLACWWSLRRGFSLAKEEAEKRRFFPWFFLFVLSMLQLQCHSAAKKETLYVSLSNPNTTVNVVAEILPKVASIATLPAMQMNISGSVAGQAFQPSAVYYYYSSVGGVLNIIFSTRNDLCTVLNNYQYPSSDRLLWFYLVNQSASQNIANDGTFKTVDPNTFSATIQSNGQNATASFYNLNAQCADLYSGGMSSTSGEITINSSYTNGGTYLQGTVDNLVLVGDSQILQGNFTALHCDLPDDFDTQVQSGLGCD